MVIESMFIIVVAGLGFSLAVYIKQKKMHKTESFVCPMKGSCSEVIHSDYSTVMCVPVETLGLIYYGVIAYGYIALSLLEVPIVWLSQSFFFLTFLALCFSFYLTGVQFLILKKLCTWCLLSAFFCATIFLLSFSLWIN